MPSVLPLRSSLYLVQTPLLAVVTNMALPDVRRRLPDVQQGFAQHGYDVLSLSAATGEGLVRFRSRVATLYAQS